MTAIRQSPFGLRSTTMSAGNYAFALYASAPKQTPVINLFSILVYDALGQVLDAAMDMPGLKLLTNVQLSDQPLKWTRADPDTRSEITMGFSLENDLPGDRRITCVMLVFPKGFMLHSPPTVQVSSNLPLFPERGIDVAQKDQLKFYLDTSRELPSGDQPFDFKFPVIVPQNLPPWNIWQLVLCRRNDCADQYVLVTFSQAGFRFGEVSPGQVKTESSAFAYLFAAWILWT